MEEICVTNGIQVYDYYDNYDNNNGIVAQTPKSSKLKNFANTFSRNKWLGNINQIDPEKIYLFSYEVYKYLIVVSNKDFIVYRITDARDVNGQIDAIANRRDAETTVANWTTAPNMSMGMRASPHLYNKINPLAEHLNHGDQSMRNHVLSNMKSAP